MSELVPTEYPDYFVCENGNLWSKKKWRGSQFRKMKPALSKFGYLYTTIRVNSQRKQIRIHQIVCESFHGKKPSWAECVRHLDGNKNNNVPSNLAWGTNIENHADRKTHGTGTEGIKNGQALLSNHDVIELKKAYASGETQSDLAKRFNVSQSTVSKIVCGRRWKHIPKALAKIDEALGNEKT